MRRSKARSVKIFKESPVKSKFDRVATQDLKSKMILNVFQHILVVTIMVSSVNIQLVQRLNNTTVKMFMESLVKSKLDRVATQDLKSKIILNVFQHILVVTIKRLYNTPVKIFKEILVRSKLDRVHTEIELLNKTLNPGVKKYLFTSAYIRCAHSGTSMLTLCACLRRCASLHHHHHKK